MKDIIDRLDENLCYLDHEINDGIINVLVCSRRSDVQCPYCGTLSFRIHSTYERCFQDLPIQGHKVYINIANRKYFCDNPNCPKKTFAESFDCLKPKAKKSNRLIDAIIKLSVEVSSVTASKLLKADVVNVSKSTICDILKKNNKSIGQGKNRENMHR